MTIPTLKPERRTRGPYAHLVPAEQIKPALIKHLADGPRTSAQLCQLVGYSEEVVRTRLNELARELRVHKIGTRGMLRARMWMWHAGPAPLDLVDDVKVGRGELPRQTTRKTYPVIGKRDHLVAALFGPARMGGA